MPPTCVHAEQTQWPSAWNDFCQRLHWYSQAVMPDKVVWFKERIAEGLYSRRRLLERHV